MQCYLGLGSNLPKADMTPSELILHAFSCVKNSSHFSDVVLSPLYRSTPYGVTDQPDFINAVLRCQTDLSAFELLDFCQDLEKSAGRIRTRHWGERTLDVDILLYGDVSINSERLTIPHKELLLRSFVVVPLLALQADLTVQGHSLAALSFDDMPIKL